MLYKRYLNHLRKGLNNWFDNYFLIKNDIEIEKIKTSAAIASSFFDDILEIIRPGITERKISDFILGQIKKARVKSAFNPIIASGWRSAFFHGPTSDKVIEEGDFIIIDYGVIYRGYNSDITRTVVVGQPNEEHNRIYNLVKNGQDIAINQLKDGASCFDIDKSVRDCFKEEKMEGYFVHGLGHGLGLSVHERPVLNRESKDILKENMIVTIEPGIYVPGFGGVRIEDDLLITKDGYEFVTQADRNLIIV